MRQKIKIAILKGLLAADGTPMPDAALNGLGVMVHPQPPLAEIISVKKEMETEGFIAGATDGLGILSWTLTVKGKHQAQQI